MRIVAKGFASLLILMIVATGLAIVAPAAAKPRALIVGVSGYPNLSADKKLLAPGNDARRIWQLLRNRGFAAADITVLADDKTAFDKTEFAAIPRGQPTRDNILAALGKLANDAQKGDFVVVYFSGHAARFPSSIPKRFIEADGQDEVLLALDAGAYDPRTGRVAGGILDDELRERLNDIRKKAPVWAIIDSCHAGGTMRSVGGDVRYKSVTYDVPLPPTQPAGAAQTADARLGQRSNLRWVSEQSGAVLEPIVAFLAVVEEKPAIERSMDDVEEKGKKADYSVFTHALIEKLSERGWASYRQLAQATYSHVDTLTQGEQIPSFEGALEASPFGVGGAGGDQPASFDAASGRLRIGVGTLAGYREKSIVAVKLAGRVIGEARITSADIMTSLAEPTKWIEQPTAADAQNLQIELIEAPVEFIMRVARPPEQDCDPDPARRGRPAGRHLATVKAAIDMLALRPTKDFPVAWVAANDKDATLRLCVSGNQLYLVGGAAPLAPKSKNERRPSPSLEIQESDDANSLHRALSDKLWTMLRFQNLLKIAAEVGNSDLARAVDIKLYRVTETGKPGGLKETDRCAGIASKEVEPPAGAKELKPGQGNIKLTHCDRVFITVENRWPKPIDVTVLYLDSEAGITAIDNDQKVRIKARGESPLPQPYGPVGVVTWCLSMSTDWKSCEAKPDRFYASVGTERLAIIVTEGDGPPFNFYYLAQPGVRAVATRSAGKETRFQTLIRESMTEDAGTRSAGVERSGEGAIRLFTWEVVPPKRK